MTKMTSNRAYLLRALYEWILDNEMTPHVLIDAEAENIQIPAQFVEDGKMVLNICPTAIQNLQLGNEWILFDARFHGTSYQISLPILSVLAIYARENGNGMIFTEEETKTSELEQNRSEQHEESKTPKGPPKLTIVS